MKSFNQSLYEMTTRLSSYMYTRYACLTHTVS